MRYVCLGYVDAPAWESLPLTERESFRDECRAYAELLAEAGHVVACEALDCEENAATLRIRHGGTAVEPGCLIVGGRTTLRGMLVIEASDMNHAIQLMARHPVVQRGGSVEVRPAATSRTAGRVDGGEKILRKFAGPVETGRSRSTNS
ncbi:YciI family protein [Lacipirellula sp.]|uniref:YciI family protein n=1 Tax=Lacipirellula sp. TaxID=2691419 RepID=UPI003D0CC2AF